MIETINGKAYLKVGDKVYELGGGSNIITADSVEQLPDPASVPEGTIALVKSEGDTKVIDLKNYSLNYDGTGTTISFNDMILTMFSQGGGTGAYIGSSQFWNDVDASEDLRFVIDVSALSDGMTIESEAIGKSKYNGEALSVETSFIVLWDLYIKVTIFFGRGAVSGDDIETKFVVNLDTLAIPGMEGV